MLEDSHAGLIVTNDRSRDLARALTNGARPLLNIDEIDDSFSCDNLNLCVSPYDKTTITYTSGSSGTPKGVVETHRYRLHDAMIHTNEIHFSVNDRLSLLHSVSFASAQKQLTGSLLNGASLFPFDIKSEGVQGLTKWLQEEQITVLHAPVAVFRHLAYFLSVEKPLPHLRLIHLSGAAITHLEFDLYKMNFSPEILLAFHMGATEAGGISSAVVDHKAFLSHKKVLPSVILAKETRFFYLMKRAMKSYVTISARLPSRAATWPWATRESRNSPGPNSCLIQAVETNAFT